MRIADCGSIGRLNKLFRNPHSAIRNVVF